MLATLLSFLLLYKYFALFVLVFATSVIVPFPGNAIVLAAGAFASLGYFNFFISLAVAVIGSVLGDSVDYWIAYRYGFSVLKFLKLDKHYYFERTEHGVRENAGLTIFITRFVGPLDQIVSFFSGAIRIPFLKFVTYDFAGNFVFTGIIFYLGYLAGTYWQNLSGIVDTAGSVLLVAIIIFLIARIFLRKQRS